MKSIRQHSSSRTSTELSMGPGTYHIPLKLFQTNRDRLIEVVSKKAPADAIVLLQGGVELPFYNTDINHNFRQESFFMWTFGVTEPGFYGAIDPTSKKAHLFIPRLPQEYAVWLGPIHEPSFYVSKYGVDEGHYVDEINDVVQKLGKTKLIILRGVNSDSDLAFEEIKFPGIEQYELIGDYLYNDMSELRVIKTPYEIDVLRYVNNISSAAHRRLMRMAKFVESEFKLESEFLYQVYKRGGCRFVSYTCICGTGKNSAILHYGHAAAPNDATYQMGDMALLDMGANYFGYCSDITCSYPIGCVFSDDQRFIYEAVLSANQAVFRACTPGVSWVDMHILANRVMLKKLTEGGLLQGDVEDMLKVGLGEIFQPHGLGHLLGLDVHDVGGYLPNCPPRPTKPGVRKLRTARVLEAGMVLTIEPGCYFIDPLLDQALEHDEMKKFIVPSVLERFRGFGGVRIEDDVLIKTNGAENLTRVPRSIGEIQSWADGHNDELY